MIPQSLQVPWTTTVVCLRLEARPGEFFRSRDSIRSFLQVLEERVRKAPCSTAPSAASAAGGK